MRRVLILITSLTVALIATSCASHDPQKEACDVIQSKMHALVQGVASEESGTDAALVLSLADDLADATNKDPVLSEFPELGELASAYAEASRTHDSIRSEVTLSLAYLAETALNLEVAEIDKTCDFQPVDD